MIDSFKNKPPVKRGAKYLLFCVYTVLLLGRVYCPKAGAGVITFREMT